MATVIRWNPMREMAAMQSVLDRMFDDAWRSARTAETSLLPVNAYETESAYIVTASLPGATTESFSISLHEGVLTISGEIPAPTMEGARVLMQERAHGHYSRTLRLPQTINADAVEAAYENGVLTLTLPKSPEAQPRTIPVRTTRNLHNGSQN